MTAFGAVRQRQELAMGRTKLDSVELEYKAPESHVARTDQEPFGEIFRRNMPYGTITGHWRRSWKAWRSVYSQVSASSGRSDDGSTWSMWPAAATSIVEPLGERPTCRRAQRRYPSRRTLAYRGLSRIVGPAISSQRFGCCTDWRPRQGTSQTREPPSG